MGKSQGNMHKVLSINVALPVRVAKRPSDTSLLFSLPAPGLSAHAVAATTQTKMVASWQEVTSILNCSTPSGIELRSFLFE